jgi:hypothetical protein
MAGVNSGLEHPGAAVMRGGAGAAVQREEFGASQLQLVRETAAAAVAAREKAAVEARYIMALQRPRNIEVSRQELLKACKYPDFASAAWYKRPAGRTQNPETGKWEDVFAEGFSIRFAEEAIRAMGNIYPDASIVYESDEFRIVRVTVTDMEANVPYSSEIVIKKQVERRKLKEGQTAIGERLNSRGEKVYLVEATEDEVRIRVNNEKSKAIRTDGLRLIPAWLKAECKRAIDATLEGEVKQDPDAQKRKVIDGFAESGVSVAELEEYLGHPMERLNPKEIIELKRLWVAVTNGEVSWAEVLEGRQASRENEPPKTGSKDAARKVAEEKLRQAKGETAEASAPIAEEEPPKPAEESTKGKPRGFDFGGGGAKK